MHAPPDPAPQVGPRAAALAAVLAALLAGCTAGSSDPAAVSGPASTVTSVAVAGGPSVDFAGTRPEVGGHPAATAALDRVAAGLPPGCAPVVERADRFVVSVTWRCGATLAAATVDLTGRRLTLGDVLTGGYASYLSSVAATQFSVEGRRGAATTDLGTWYLTPVALDVAFPAGVVTYPLASLGPYLRDPTAL